LHDFGKVYVEERVLRKPGKLSPTELEQSQQGCRRVLGSALVKLRRMNGDAGPQRAHALAN